MNIVTKNTVLHSENLKKLFRTSLLSIATTSAIYFSFSYEIAILKNVKFRISGLSGGKTWQISQTQSRVHDDIGQDSLEWIAPISHSLGTTYLIDPKSAEGLKGILGLLTVEMLKKLARRKGMDIGEFKAFLKDAKSSPLRNPILNARYRILSLDPEKAKQWIDEEAEQELLKWSLLPPSISLTRKELSLNLNLSMLDFESFKALVALGLYLSKKTQSVD